MVEIFEQEAKINVISDQWLTFYILTLYNIKKLQKGEKNDVKFGQNCTISKWYFLILK